MARSSTPVSLQDKLEIEPSIHPGENATSQSPVIILLVLICTAGILAYAGFLLNPGNRGDLLPYAMVITAESVLIFHALLSMWTILSGSVDPRNFAFHRAQSTLFVLPAGHRAELSASQRRRLGERPETWAIRLNDKRVDVDVFITVYGEDIDKVRATVAAALRMRGTHRTWVLDDGQSDEVKQLAADLGAWYVRRLTNHGAKAGNINHALSLAKGDFFAIFDADFVPNIDFLYETMPFFIDEKVAFVQTPQSYANLTTTIARGAAYMQSMFYRFIQPGRNRFNAAFCVGTNVIFRRTAIDEVGGLYTDSKSEDVWTSLMLHERGWKTIFIPTVLAIGDAPETIEAYSKQQLRWASGGFESC